jgi:DNA-binding NtrC family response regulator
VDNSQEVNIAHPVDQSIDEWVSTEVLGRGIERLSGMLVCSDQLRKVVKTILRLGPYKQTVLIQGESGTGKELIARALHTSGPTPNGPFVTFNCSNLLDSLAESQLFGHMKGSFTDAREDSLGYFRSANGGTLFLDEIGELPLKLQPKLLRAVENHEVQPVGSSKNYQVDIRLVAATNRDLAAMIKVGTFREDLFYRLNSSTINIPPLRDRTPAIPCFVSHFIGHYNKMFGKSVKQVSRRAVDALCAYQWPGNIRELAHVIESAMLMTDADQINLADLPDIISNHPTPALEQTVPLTRPFGDPEIDRVIRAPARGAITDWNLPDESPLLLDDVIKHTLLRSLEQTEGNRRRAASLLGVSRSTLYRMLGRYSLCDTGQSSGLAIETASV